MAYLFFLGAVPLPITPSALTIKTPSMNKTVTLVNEGEINIPKRSGLREISFEFLLPQVQKYPFANYQLGSYTASVMIPLLNVWKNTCIPFRFIVTRMSPSGGILYFTYIKCVIEDFEYNEDAEAHGLDVMCSINLKEYVDYGTKIVNVKDVQNQQNSTTRRATVTQNRPSKPQPSTVTGGENSNLSSVSAEMSGNPNNWRQVAQANGFAVGESSPLQPMEEFLDLNSGQLNLDQSFVTPELGEHIPLELPVPARGLDTLSGSLQNNTFIDPNGAPSLFTDEQLKFNNPNAHSNAPKGGDGTLIWAGLELLNPFW